MIGHTISAYYILIGLFLCLGAYLAVRFFYLKFKYDEIPINKRHLFNKHRFYIRSLALTPVLAYLTYLIMQNRIGFVESTIILIAPVLFLIAHEFIFFRPHLNTLINEVEKLLATLKLTNKDEKYNFEPEEAKALFSWDLPEYRFSSLSSIKIDRVYKNAMGEYFSVIASTDGYYEPKIEHISAQVAKRLLSKDREVFINEFNEEPNYKSK